jgi:tetratricopeptide (TPR) repeat protein
MSPYTHKILRLIGGAVFSISITSVIATYTTLRDVSHSVLLFGLVAVGLAGLAAYILFYFSQISETNNLVGIYMSVRELKKSDVRLAKALNIQAYNKYYRKRKEDNAIRESLKMSSGVVILGRPFAGKTRAALEAVVETDLDAYIISFTSSEQITSDKIKEIFLPCFFIFFAKPAVILLINAEQRSAHYPFEELWARLRKQCSRISIIVTCRSGVGEKTLAEGEIQQLVRGLRRVELGPLDPQARTDIYFHVWNEQPGPLGIDMSLPGLIIFGPKEMRETYAQLPFRSKRVITALGLARACGAEACERALLNEILKNVLAQDIVGIEGEISDMGEKYVLMADERDRISLQNDEFVVADYSGYYPTFLKLKKDLEKVESLPAVSGNADRLLQLGFYYWSRFQDFNSAHRAMESSLQVKSSPLAHASLARLYMWLGEPERARTAINAAVAATSEENQKAVTLLLFADEILFKGADGEKAAGWYALAAQHADDSRTSARISFRQGDCLVRLKRFSEAESIYRDYLTKAPAAEKSAATARLVLTMLAQDRVLEARRLLRQTWNSMIREEWLALAMLVVESSEGFSDVASYLQRTSDAVWEEYCDCVLSLQESDGISFLLFAETCLMRGFLAPALTAYRSLIDQPARFGIQEADVTNCWLNLGAGLRDRQQFADARAAFGGAEKLVRQNPARRNALTYVLAGLADCDLFETHSDSEAAPQYGKALDLAREYGDENAISWAQMGLGDIALMNGDFVEAKKNYLAPELIVNSVSGRSRTDLGLARAYLELDELDDAEIYVANGIASTLRLDYRFRQMQFQELRKRLAKKRATSVSTVAGG